MNVIYAGQPLPEVFTSSVYLGGPAVGSFSWRVGALAVLESLGYGGVVFVPEIAPGSPPAMVAPQWEKSAMAMSDVVLYWVGAELSGQDMLEMGMTCSGLLEGGRLLYGTEIENEAFEPLIAELVGAGLPVYRDLSRMLEAGCKRVGVGVERRGVERQIPLRLFKSRSFQSWLWSLRTSGNELHGVSVAGLIAPIGDVEKWVIRPKIYVGRDGALHENEFVLGQSDAVYVAAYAKGPTARETLFLLVREISAGARGCVVHQFPSQMLRGPDLVETGVEGLLLKTGLRVEPERLRGLGTRHISTRGLSARGHVYCVELLPEEITRIQGAVEAGRPFGDGADGPVFVELVSFGDLLSGDLLDWALVGMLAGAITATGS